MNSPYTQEEIEARLFGALGYLKDEAFDAWIKNQLKLIIEKIEEYQEANHGR